MHAGACGRMWVHVGASKLHVCACRSDCVTGLAILLERSICSAAHCIRPAGVPNVSTASGSGDPLHRQELVAAEGAPRSSPQVSLQGLFSLWCLFYITKTNNSNALEKRDIRTSSMAIACCQCWQSASHRHMTGRDLQRKDTLACI